MTARAKQRTAVRPQTAVSADNLRRRLPRPPQPRYSRSPPGFGGTRSAIANPRACARRNAAAASWSRHDPSVICISTRRSHTSTSRTPATCSPPQLTGLSPDVLRMVGGDEITDDAILGCRVPERARPVLRALSTCYGPVLGQPRAAAGPALPSPRSPPSPARRGRGRCSRRHRRGPGGHPEAAKLRGRDLLLSEDRAYGFPG